MGKFVRQGRSQADLARKMNKNKPRGEAIHQYRRDQAIEQGFLIDVTETATEAGIDYPTALTVAVWESCVRVPAEITWRNEKERLWEILTVLYCAISRQGVGLWQVPFSALLHNDAGRLHRTELVAICGPGDDGEPVITVLMFDED